MSPTLPPQAYAAALAGLESMTLHRLAALLRHRDPVAAWAVAMGEAPADGLIARVLADSSVRSNWLRSARRSPPEAVWERCESLGLEVRVLGDEGYPPLLATDRLPPPVLFALGDLALLSGRRVGMVGTRNATASGRHAARCLAAGLAMAGVHVVSGLARGIDGVAHRAVLTAEGEGRPIAVVGSGLDVVYPREHRDLWNAVANCGLLLSEWPPGVGPAAHQFPLRNRIIAALSEIVVVVESRERGGSLITASEALERGVPVMAVPGSAVTRAAAGTNGLLRDGAAPAADVDDVLTALALGPSNAQPFHDVRPRPSAADRDVYDCLRVEPRTVDGVALACSRSLVEAAMSLARLEQCGWISGVDGWFECVGAPLR